MLLIFVWLGALTAAAGIVALLAYHIAMGRHSWRTICLTTAFLALGYCLLAADSLNLMSRMRLDGGTLLLLSAGVIVLAALAVALQFGVCRYLRPHRSARWTRTGLAGLLVCQIVIAGWAGWRFRQMVSASDELPLLGSVDFQVIDGEALLTDKGRLVPVYRARLADNLPPYIETLEGAFTNRRITRSGRDAKTNCHGWVFTGGQYLLMGQNVDVILADNGYYIVNHPQEGDIIIYRNAFKQILHTGLVRSAWDDGTVLIESKWGIDERFVHLPEDQHYSQQFTYYRRHQPSRLLAGGADHLVQAVKVLPGNVVVSQRPEEALVARPQSPEGLELMPGSSLPLGDSYPLGAE